MSQAIAPQAYSCSPTQAGSHRRNSCGGTTRRPNHAARDCRAAPRRLPFATLGERPVAMRAGNLNEAHEYLTEKKSQPRAFAPALFAHPVHALVPVAGAHKRQAAVTIIETVQDGSDTVIVTGRLLRARRAGGNGKKSSYHRCRTTLKPELTRNISSMSVNPCILIWDKLAWPQEPKSKPPSRSF
jgi:hypothetical protein